MNTEKRLNKAYKNAKVFDLDTNSRYVVFSDAHRSDGSRSDEFTSNEIIFLYALSYYYKNGFTFIEAGDGEELWEHPKFRFIRKAHYLVYDKMKNFYDDNRLEILYGNHNIYLKNDTYLSNNFHSFYSDRKGKTLDLFKGIKPQEAIVFKHTKTQQEFMVVHGHQGDAFNDQLWFFSMLSLKFLWRYFHALGATNPASPVKNITRQHKIEKSYIKWIEKYKTAIICGHTHRYKFPLDNEPPYFNTGCCIFPENITGIEIVNDMIMLVRWKVIPDDNGVLKIERLVIRGPMTLEEYKFI